MAESQVINRQRLSAVLSKGLVLLLCAVPAPLAWPTSTMRRNRCWMPWLQDSLVSARPRSGIVPQRTQIGRAYAGLLFVAHEGRLGESGRLTICAIVLAMCAALIVSWAAASSRLQFCWLARW